MAPGRSILDRLRARRAGGHGEERSVVRGLRSIRSRPRGESGSVRLFGRDFGFVDGRSLYAQIKEIFVRRAYDFQAGRDDPEILDCGGNVGVAALRFRRLYPEAQIRVFEADPDLARLLARNLSAAGDTRTKVVHAAVWSHDGRVRFAPQMGDLGRVDPSGALEVPCVDVAGLCAAPVDLLKLDVEGAEQEVLERLIESGAARRVRRIVCEWHETGIDPPRLHRMLGGLWDAGFDYRLSGAGSSPELNPGAGDSGFARLPYRGATALIYAWQRDASH